jgi:hypothetical protein
MKKAIFIFFALVITLSSYAQFGYKHKLDPVGDVEISYKIVHEKFFDKESPVQLRLKLKNTNDYDLTLNFEIQYQFDLTKKYNSGEVEIEIPRKSAKTGKIHGLVFEINSTDPKVFESENAEWEFLKFNIEMIKVIDK